MKVRSTKYHMTSTELEKLLGVNDKNYICDVSFSISNGFTFEVVSNGGD
jgi:hypothetical protein